MTTNQSNTISPLFHSEGFALVVLTAAAYAASLLWEMGYGDFFGIPRELIGASHIGLVLTAKAIGYGVIAYLGKVNLVWVFAPKSDGFLPELIRRSIGFGLILGFGMYPYLATDLSFWWYAGTMGFVVIILFIGPLMTQRKTTGYENKLLEQAKIEQGVKDLYSIAIDRLPRSTFITFLLVTSIMAFAYGDGRKEAHEQTEFNLLAGQQNLVLLRIYGDVVVCVGFDPKTNKLDGRIAIERIPEGAWLTTSVEKVGKLQKYKTPEK